MRRLSRRGAAFQRPALQKLGILGGALALSMASASSAFAYCRTTTCDLNVTCEENPTDCCEFNGEGCDTRGLPISWSSSCVSWAVQEDASPAENLDAEQTRIVVEKAFAAWTAVLCQGAAPSITTEYLGLASCHEQLFLKSGGNANVWMYRDDAWPYAEDGPNDDLVNASALALTTVTFNPKTGEMLDADVEFNSAQMSFTTTDATAENDLLSIATHEAGHFLGLDHSASWDATMAPGYVSGSTLQRSLSYDDEQGFCSVYPPSRVAETDSCTPLGGLNPSCSVDGGGGCSVAARPLGGGPRRENSFGTWLSLGLVGLGLGLRLRRRALRR